MNSEDLPDRLSRPFNLLISGCKWYSYSHSEKVATNDFSIPHFHSGLRGYPTGSMLIFPSTEALVIRIFECVTSGQSSELQGLYS